MSEQQVSGNGRALGPESGHLPDVFHEPALARFQFAVEALPAHAEAFADHYQNAAGQNVTRHILASRHYRGKTDTFVSIEQTEGEAPVIFVQEQNDSRMLSRYYVKDGRVRRHATWMAINSIDKQKEQMSYDALAEADDVALVGTAISYARPLEVYASDAFAGDTGNPFALPSEAMPDTIAEAKAAVTELRALVGAHVDEDEKPQAEVNDHQQFPQTSYLRLKLEQREAGYDHTGTIVRSPAAEISLEISEPAPTFRDILAETITAKYDGVPPGRFLGSTVNKLSLHINDAGLLVRRVTVEQMSIEDRRMKIVSQIEEPATRGDVWLVRNLYHRPRTIRSDR